MSGALSWRYLMIVEANRQTALQPAKWLALPLRPLGLVGMPNSPHWCGHCQNIGMFGEKTDFWPTKEQGEPHQREGGRERVVSVRLRRGKSLLLRPWCIYDDDADHNEHKGKRGLLPRYCRCLIEKQAR